MSFLSASSEKMVAAVYEAFYEIERPLFVRDIPSGQPYESATMEDTLGRLAYVADRQLFAVVTADAGCVKSTLIRRFAASLPKEECSVLYLSDSKLTFRRFYKGILEQLGIESRFYSGAAKRQFQKELEIIHDVQGEKVVYILDEAHLREKYGAILKKYSDNVEMEFCVYCNAVFNGMYALE